jgi:hypothetical protein
MLEPLVLVVRVVVGSILLVVGRARRRAVEVLRPVLG